MKNILDFLKKLFKRPPLLHVAHDSGGHHKPTILLIHGIATTSGFWEQLFHELDENKYRVVALDLLGCGGSPRPKKYEYKTEDFVKSIHRTVRKLHLKKPYFIVGHSMGANIVARYCVTYPQEIESEYLLSMPLYLKKYDKSSKIGRQTDMFLKAYDFMLKNKNFTINAAQTIRKIMNIKEGIDVTAADWESFSLSLKNTVINQRTLTDIKNTKTIPIEVIYGNMDEFLVQDNLKQLDDLKNVQVTKLFAVDHRMSRRFARAIVSKIDAKSVKK